MYIYKELVTDEACEKSKNKILRKLRMHAGMVDVYLIWQTDPITLIFMTVPA